MMNSLLVKLGMVAVTMGIVYWIGWPLHGPHGAGQPPALQQAVMQTVSQHQDRVSQLSVQPTVPQQIASLTTMERTGSIKLSSDRLVDLNRANAGELEALPGIGAVLAQRVIDFRQSVGGFRTIEDLRGVKGIGAKKFDRIKPLVTVSAGDHKERMEQRML